MSGYSVSVASVPNQRYQQVIQAGNYKVITDASPKIDPKTNQPYAGTGPTPIELFLGALGACTSITLQMYAEQKGWDLQEVKVDLSETKDPTTKAAVINKDIQVKGTLDAAQLQRLKTIAEACPVNKLINGPKTVNASLNLVV